mmetsp:Transcript_5025/g.9694  ORF Transcript_5025/g.9694 Transcript_5025/m.9694 type:complete len:318 (-) Transcript_5025:14-967(-)
MSRVISWYIHLLKTHPIKTNLCTASLLMVGGDFMAQEIERYHLEDEFTLHEHDLDGVPERRRIHMHPYWGFVNKGNTSLEDDNGDGSAISTTCTDTNNPLVVAVDRIVGSIRQSIERNDWIRTTSMGLWSVLFYTPAYMALYAAFDRVFKARTPLAVGARVAGALVYSIPVNALFFVYGTSVHHTMEWYGLWDSLLADAEEEADWTMNTSSDNDGDDADATADQKTGRNFFLPLPERPPPYDVEMMLSKARLKIETELISTVTNSAKMWIPINIVNFAVVPNHLRPFGLLFFSVFWNCYLSLVQHRDVPLPQDVIGS